MAFEVGALQNDQQTRAESTTGLVEQVKTCLQSGDYSRAVDVLRGTAAEFPDDAELSELEKLAQDGLKRKSEADRLITESQELFAQQKPDEAIQLLRQAYELDRKNSLARSILSNALVEHARSVVETDWLESERLTNQALSLNPAHPTAKTILDLILDRKTTSPVEDWVSQARKLQSSGDLFAALAWVAEGLAVHPHDAKLLQIQDAIQRDQGIQRRHARRRDLEDLQRMEREIDAAADAAEKRALAERIQAMAAKYWTDGAILTVANRLLQRLGAVPQESCTASPPGPAAAVIFHVPRPSAAKPAATSTGQTPSQVTTSQVTPSPVAASKVPPIEVTPSAVPAGNIPAPIAPGKLPPVEESPAKELPIQVPSGVEPPAAKIPPSLLPPEKVPQEKASPTTPEPQPSTPQAAGASAAEASAPAAKVPFSFQQERPTRSNFTSLILVSAAAAIVAVAVTLFFAQKYYAPPVAKNSAAASAISAPTASAASVSAPKVPAPAASPSAPSTPKPPLAALSSSSGAAAAKVTPADLPANDQPINDQPPAESGHNLGSLLVVAGQDDARVFLNGKPQPLLTQAGQLRIPNLELKDYVVQVSKSGFQDPPRQEIHIRRGEQARLVFNFQAQPQSQPQLRMASLTIQGGAPGATVFVDQTFVGTVQPDGTLVSTVNPGDHTVELRQERFKPRQLKRHFVVGETVSLSAADAALEAAPGELKITFVPPGARVALVKGERLTMVTSGVPLILAAGTYTLTARPTDGFSSSATLEVIAGQSKTLNLSLAPNGMSKWDDPGAWTQKKDSFIHKGGDFVLYGVAPASGTFAFSAMPAKGRLLQWVVNYTDPNNYVLFQLDDNNFYRTVMRNGHKTDEIKVPDKGDKKTFRTFHIRVSPTELVSQVKHGDSWSTLDRWTQPGVNPSLGKFGFYIPGEDQVAISNFAHYPDLNLR